MISQPKTDFVLWALANLMSEDALVISADGTYDGIDWMGISESERPSRTEVEAEILRIQTVVLPTDKYRQDRALAYPNIGDQLDALYHAGVFPPEMEAQIAAVKKQYPKPTAQ
jgi:hypothetical protein